MGNDIDKNDIDKKDNLKVVTYVVKGLAILIALGVAFISRYAFIFFIFGMLPTIVSVLVDKRLNKFASSTISAFNLVGILPFLFTIGKSNDINDEAQRMLTDIYIWFTVYGSAALGWLFIWAIPQITSKIFITRANMKSRGLEKSQQLLVEEWGSEIKKL